MIHKTSFLNQESPWHALKIFKLLNQREEWENNVGKTAVIFLQIFRETLGTLARSLGLKLVGYKTLLYLITGALNSSKFM